MANDGIDFQPIDFEPDTASPAGEPGMPESFVRGFANGSTLGAAPKLTGAAEAGLDTLEGKNKNLNDIVAAYKKHRDESEANYDAAEKANPMTTLAGNAASFLNPYNPLMKIGGVAGEATTALGKGYEALKGGAALGGAAGVLGSRSDTLGGVASDALQGAAVGGALGAAGSAIGQGVKGALSQGKASGIGSKLMEARAAGQEGVPLLTKGDFESVGAGNLAKGQEIADQLAEQKQTAGQFRGNEIQQATAQGKTLNAKGDMSDIITNTLANPANASDPSVQSALKLVEEIHNAGDMTPEVAQSYKGRLEDMLDFKKNGGVQVGGAADKMINDARDSLAGKINNEVLSPSGRMASADYGGIANLQNMSGGDIANKYKSLVEAAADKGSMTNQKNLSDFIDTVRTGLGDDYADQLEQGINKAGSRYQTAQAAAAYDPMAHNIISKVMGSVLSAPLKIANVEGIAERGISTGLNEIMQQQPAAIRKVVEVLQSSASKSAQMLGKALDKANSTNDGYKRKALLFAITQNPSYRDMLGLDDDKTKPKSNQ